MTILVSMMALMGISLLLNARVRTLFLNSEPGVAMLQYGQRGSSALINFLQFGQRIDVIFGPAVGIQ